MASGGAVPGTKVFLVHGHDGDTKQQVTFLEGILGERPVILHERPSSGRTLIEKFEDHAAEVGFAVVLLTSDDVGAAKGERTPIRAPVRTSSSSTGSSSPSSEEAG